MPAKPCPPSHDGSMPMALNIPSDSNWRTNWSFDESPVEERLLLMQRFAKLTYSQPLRGSVKPNPSFLFFGKIF
jgi:hypothetical protein